MTLKTAIAWAPAFFSAMLNAYFYFGVAPTALIGLLLGGALFFGDLAKPLCFKYPGWKLCGAILVVISMAASGQFMFRNMTQDANTNTDAAGRIAVIDAELSTLPTVPATLEQVAALRAAASREGGRGGCGPKCEELQRQATELDVQRSGFDRRKALETERADLKGDAVKAGAALPVLFMLIVSGLAAIGVEIAAIAFPLLREKEAQNKRPKPQQQAAKPDMIVSRVVNTIAPETKRRKSAKKKAPRLTDEQKRDIAAEAHRRYRNGAGESKVKIAEALGIAPSSLGGIMKKFPPTLRVVGGSKT